MWLLLNGPLACGALHHDHLLARMTRHLGIRCAQALASAPCFDVVVVGGGIVGSATARQLLLNQPSLKMAILEKEPELGMHQTGHNSGVIHAGIYYKPGSLKAKLCVEGAQLAYQYLEEKRIPHKRVGKLIVACDRAEVDRLMELYRRSQENQVPGVQLLQGAAEIQAIEPKCIGLAAIWSPNTGIVDWGRVNRRYGQDFEEAGGRVLTGFRVIRFEFEGQASRDHYPITITAENGQQVRTRFVIAAAGLHADKVARLTNGKPVPKIGSRLFSLVFATNRNTVRNTVPFRGEYLVLKRESCNLIRTNIYPVPDPRFPFLGVHFTPRMDGSIWAGPNAVLAFKREGYRYRDVSLSEFLETVTFPGFLRLAGLDEFHRSLSVAAQVRKLQRFVPSITVDDIDRTQRVAGVRAQALDQNGNLVDDFVFETDHASHRVLHVRNAPSPGATSSLAIAKVIAQRAQHDFQL